MTSMSKEVTPEIKSIVSATDNKLIRGERK
jgi:hypothetical protein